VSLDRKVSKALKASRARSVLKGKSVRQDLRANKAYLESVTSQVRKVLQAHRGSKALRVFRATKASKA